jgi:hypothetical protein
MDGVRLRRLLASEHPDVRDASQRLRGAGQQAPQRSQHGKRAESGKADEG